MKRIYVFLGGVLLALLSLAAYGRFGHAAQDIIGGVEVKSTPVIAGMNSVLMDDGEIWSLGLNGWKLNGRAPVSAARVAFLLGADRLVDKDGRGWVSSRASGRISDRPCVDRRADWSLSFSAQTDSVSFARPHSLTAMVPGDFFFSFRPSVDRQPIKRYTIALIEHVFPCRPTSPGYRSPA